MGDVGVVTAARSRSPRIGRQHLLSESTIRRSKTRHPTHATDHPISCELRRRPGLFLICRIFQFARYQLPCVPALFLSVSFTTVNVRKVTRPWLVPRLPRIVGWRPAGPRVTHLYVTEAQLPPRADVHAVFEVCQLHKEVVMKEERVASDRPARS